LEVVQAAMRDALFGFVDLVLALEECLDIGAVLLEAIGNAHLLNKIPIILILLGVGRARPGIGLALLVPLAGLAALLDPPLIELALLHEFLQQQTRVHIALVVELLVDESVYVVPLL
jgi:hypothetical protein